MDRAKAKYLRTVSLGSTARPSERPSKEIREEWQEAIKKNLERWREQKQS